MLLHTPVTFKTYTSLSVSESDFSITVSIDFLLLSESPSLQFFLGVLWCIICKGKENLMQVLWNYIKIQNISCVLANN